MRVTGFCRPIVDWTVAMEPSEALGVLGAAGLGSGVTFVGDAVLETVRAAIGRLPHHHEEASPGGPVSNAIFSLARAAGPYPRGFEIAWAGPYPGGTADTAYDPLPSLRAVGVTTHALPSTQERTPTSLCIVDHATGETLAILVGDREPIDASALGTPPDLALLMLSDLPALLPSLEPTTRIALMTADLERLDDPLVAALTAAAGRIAFVFTSMPELHRLGLLAPRGEPHEFFAGAEVVATDSSDPVHVWDAARREPARYPVPSEADARGSFLGAGDAYSGAYLAARMGGLGTDEAHAVATTEARISSYQLRARSLEPTNLTALFGDFIERASDTPDWHLFERVRQTSGTTVVTSYNSGVDTLGGSVADELGLAWFAVMPAGRRRDEGGPQLASRGGHLLELGTPSYRYCTWTNAYLADGTLLLDVSRGEGSEETRRACRMLGRPLLELNLDDHPATIRHSVAAWARAFAVKTVQVAGSRAAGLTEPDLNRARAVLRAALLGVAATHASGLPAPVPPPSAVSAASIGIPRLPEVSAGALEELRAAGLADGLDLDSLVWEVEGERIVRAKSRDLVSAVASGMLDLAVVGEDMILDAPAEDSAELEVIARAGVFNALLAAVGPSEPRAEHGLVASQYPRVASLFAAERGANVWPVAGAGEGWVEAGIADYVVDTWRTGRTAEEHGLRLVRELARTSLVLVARRGATPVSRVAPWLFNRLAGEPVDWDGAPVTPR